MTSAKPFVDQALTFLTTTEPALLGQYALALVSQSGLPFWLVYAAAAYCTPVVSGRFAASCPISCSIPCYPSSPTDAGVCLLPGAPAAARRRRPAARLCGRHCSGRRTVSCGVGGALNGFHVPSFLGVGRCVCASVCL